MNRWLTVSLILAACTPNGDGCSSSSSNGTLQYGDTCEISDQCEGVLVCASDEVCRYPGEPGTAAADEACVSTAWCERELACSSEGVCTEPGAPGTAGLGEICDDTPDCQLGLSCKEGACYGFGIPAWAGAECDERDADEGAFRAYFEVPRGGVPLDEFYRLPYPNDARVQADGTLDLVGHPSPGALIPELGDPVGEILDAMRYDFAGFGTNAAVFFRFSQTISFSNLTLGYPEAGTAGIVDLTEGATYSDLVPASYRAATARGQYICYNWLAIHPTAGRPLLPGHTYVAYVTSTIEARDTGGAISQDADFAAMLSDAQPGDADLSRAWSAYAPLRQWLADTDRSPQLLAGATVFTVQDPTAPLLALYDAVQIGATPALEQLHLCGEDPGPFADPDDPDRGCDGVDPAFHEVQGLVSLQQYQAGTPPFKDADDGGYIRIVDGSLPAPTYTEPVTMALTVPTGPMPEDGWPLVIYGHGTGGNYRSFVTNGLAERLASVELDDGTEVAFAVLSIDAVVHGPRRHEENWSADWLALDPDAYEPEALFFNPINPWASRDNPLQSAADHWQLVRLVQELDLAGEDSPTGEAIRFDLDNVYYLGHSQGALTGVGFVAYEPEIDGVVLSGAGGLLIESMLNKRLPVDVPAAMAVGLADPAIDRYHPILNLVQAGAERADPLNHAVYVVDEPLEGMPYRSVLQTFGVGDGYAPDVTQQALARGLHLGQVLNGSDPLESLVTYNPPVVATHNGQTAIVALYEGDGEADPHYVLFTNELAQRQVDHFLGTAVRDGIPTVVAP